MLWAPHRKSICNYSDFSGKDGPSMMLPIICAIVSLEIKEKTGVMTGEVDLDRNKLRVAGMTPNIMCAVRHGLKVVIPIANKIDLKKIDIVTKAVNHFMC